MDIEKNAFADMDIELVLSSCQELDIDDQELKVMRLLLDSLKHQTPTAFKRPVAWEQNPTTAPKLVASILACVPGVHINISGVSFGEVETYLDKLGAKHNEDTE
jgi:hypothetical protein